MISNHTVDFGSQFRNGIDSLVAAECLCRDNKSRWDRHPKQVQLLQVIGFVANKDLVVHLGRFLPERADQHLRIICHDVADQFRVKGSFHCAQRVQNAANEIVQRLHQEGIR